MSDCPANTCTCSESRTSTGNETGRDTNWLSTRHICHNRSPEGKFHCLQVTESRVIIVKKTGVSTDNTYSELDATKVSFRKCVLFSISFLSPALAVSNGNE